MLPKPASPQRSLAGQKRAQEAQARRAAAVRGVVAAANRAIAAGRRLSRRRSRAGEKLVALARQAIQKTKVSGEAFGQAPPPLRPGFPTPPEYIDPATAPMQNMSETELTMIERAARAFAASMQKTQAIIEAVTQLAELYDKLLDEIEIVRQKGFFTLVSAGEAIAARADAIIVQASDTGVDESVISQAASIRADVDRWRADVQAAFSGAPQIEDVSTQATSTAVEPAAAVPAEETAPGFFPGTPGGGGGESYEESSYAEPAYAEEEYAPAYEEGEPASEALARFRESGGAWDPFEEQEYYEEPVEEEYYEEDPFEDGETYDEVYASPNEDLFETSDESFDESFFEAPTALEGLEFQWQDIFHPAGVALRAYQEYLNRPTEAPFGKMARPENMQAKSTEPSVQAKQKQTAAQARLAELLKKKRSEQLAEIVRRLQELRAAGVEIDEQEIWK
jgi:hypothetical protein